jgi:hypothetical protein
MTDEPDNPEVFIREGEAWIPDGAALARRVGAAYMYFSDGELYAGIPGRGDYLVRDVLAEKPESTKPALASVQSIK